MKETGMHQWSVSIYQNTYIYLNVCSMKLCHVTLCNTWAPTPNKNVNRSETNNQLTSNHYTLYYTIAPSFQCHKISDFRGKFENDIKSWKQTKYKRTKAPITTLSIKGSVESSTGGNSLNSLFMLWNVSPARVTVTKQNQKVHK